MEKFAIDIDKVLDDFELDEDECEAKKYENLHLEFQPDSHIPSKKPQSFNQVLDEPVSLVCNTSGLEVLAKEVANAKEIEQPPGTRSPPDGQYDDESSSNSCLKTSVQSLFSSYSHHRPNNVHHSFEAGSSLNLEGSSFQRWPVSNHSLWPHFASGPAGQVASTNQNSSVASQRVLDSVLSVNCLQNNNDKASRTFSESDNVNNTNVLQHPESTSDIKSVVDVVPSDVSLSHKTLEDCNESRQPDIIEILKLNQDYSYASNSDICQEFVSELPRNSNTNYSANESSNLDIAEPEVRLLPDLMSVNRDDNEHSEPAIVTENVLTLNHCTNPAIVVESQATYNIPEVANIHQTMERSQYMSEACIGSSLSEDDSSFSDKILESSSSTYASLPEQERSTSYSLPDVSDVGKPVVFNPCQEISEEELDAELAELEQAGLQEAYNMSNNGAMKLQHSEISSSKMSFEISCGPDIINGSDIKHVASDVAAEFVPDSSDECRNSNFSISSSYCSDNSEVKIVQYKDGVQEELHSLDYTEEIGSMPQSAQFNLDENTKSLKIDSSDVVSNNEKVCASSSMVVSSVDDTESSLPANEQNLVPNTVPALSDKDVAPGSLVTAVYEDDEDNRESSFHEESHSSLLAIGDCTTLGYVAPSWIPDEEAPFCQECGTKFNVLRRRHHCRACGRVLCAPCCHFKTSLPFMDYKEARVCSTCLQILKSGANGRRSNESQNRSTPDPNNPMEYCSRIPPSQLFSTTNSASPTVMVPVGVLKRDGSNGSSRTRSSKQVMFSDGIRPGGDLSEEGPYGNETCLKPVRAVRRVQQSMQGKRVNLHSLTNGVMYNETGLPSHLIPLGSFPSDQCLMGADDLPPIVKWLPIKGGYFVDEAPDWKEVEEMLRADGPPVVFAVHKNLKILIKIIKLDCCVGVEIWNFTTQGMCTVGQEEIVILLEYNSEETKPPKDVFSYFYSVYQQANQGALVTEMGHTIFTEPEGFLGSKDHGGFIYVRPTFQCLHNLILPPIPYIFAILIQKWEAPWAKVFPLRLILRLGAEFRYYPCPLISTRNRKPVFCEIGHTIMNLLVDFRNYAYTVPIIQGFLLQMEDKKTTLVIPKNRYDQISKALSNSNDHVLALGATFSPLADSHLVAVENDDGHYITQAINIHNKPRQVTGASFIVFNGALKTNCGLTAKSSIVEDGLMVQISSDMMIKLRDALKNMKNFEIPCGPSSSDKPDEVVTVKWTSDDKNFNVGVKSIIDGKLMDGISSLKVHSAADYVSDDYLIRWTEIFFIQGEGHNTNADVNLSRISEKLAKAFCIAVTPHLNSLFSSAQSCLALRANMHVDNVGYEAGSCGTLLSPQYMNDLDTELIPVIHGAASSIIDEPIVLELLFHILEQ